ncbi:methionyl-tRNA formyltransferase [Candidatus Shapirobacteria bacterium]|nr:methionyl-tRNA formyltransferase [Candidatus Shapirobacteria bacterium]
MKTQIVFFGSDQYGQKVLEVLKKSPQLEIARVVKDKDDLQGLQKALLRPDLGLVASFGALIPQELLHWPKYGILNLHPSLLPKYRGPTPVPTAILKGEKETGLTIIKIDEQIDHGPILAQFKEPIKPQETSEDLLNRLFTLGADVLLTILPGYLEGRIKERKQDHSQATYTQKLTRQDGQIDWTKPAEYQERFVRAMFPWPGAWAEVKINQQVKRLKILKAHLEGKKLVLDSVQLEGKKPVTWKQFLEGYPQAKILS